MNKLLFESKLKKALEALKKKFSVSVGNNDSLAVKTNSSDKFMYNRIKDILDNAKIGKYYLSASGTTGNYNVVFEFVIRQKIKTLIKEQLNIIKESEKDDAVKIFIDGYPWYLQKIDSTHFHMSNSPNKIWNSMSYHIGQHRNEPYYSDVDKWLHGGFKIDDKKYFSDGKNENIKEAATDRTSPTPRDKGMIIVTNDEKYIINTHVSPPQKELFKKGMDITNFIRDYNKISAEHTIKYYGKKGSWKILSVPYDYNKNRKYNGEAIEEKAVSKAQQRFFGMVDAAQKGEKPVSKEIGDAAKNMKKKDVKDFAKTKHTDLPERVPKKENIEEEIPWDQDRSQRKNKIKNVPKKFKDIYKKSDIERSSNKKQFDGKKK